MAGSTRAKWILLVALVIAMIGGYFVWQYLSQWESTDDAQVDGHIHPVNARVAGTVIAVEVKENEHVKADTVVVQLDPRDYKVAVARAEADLAAAEAAVVGARANIPIASSTAGTQISSTAAATARAHANLEAAKREVMAAQAHVGAAEARVKETQAAAVKATRDLDRMKMLIDKDEISQQQYDAAVSAADVARATVESAQAAASQVQHEVDVAKAHTAQSEAELQLAEAEAEGAKTAPKQVTITKAEAQSAEARVQLAKAALDQARLNLEYTTIKAPVNGIISKKTVEVGQVVQQGQPLMAVVPHEDIWITANFKETQLAGMHPGQAATVSVDAYSRSYNAHIDSIASATGAKFSLLPPENATGNYVKVVQRVPVKMVLDEGQDPDRQLRPGMSVVAKVKVK
jgi:membrane fusion protein, multidrug efflux system